MASAPVHRLDLSWKGDPHEVSALELVERLAEDMVRRWRAGQAPRVEDYLPSHPQLLQSPAAVLELISEELSLRQEHGQDLNVRELENRFPQWKTQVRALLECHQAMAVNVPASCYPAPGESLGEFHLLAEIGRGSHARVFLARQPALADRLVVLKVGPSIGREHLCLARLQHTHIVPLYSTHDFPIEGMRALCLPYFGGGTLERILEILKERPPTQRRAQDVLEALRRLQTEAPVQVPIAGPACRFLARATHEQAVCWIGVCLADALQYAHERGFVHLDLKPSNVLLAADGQPMLLDFHLARGPLLAGSPAPAWLGGTPGYMAPEQREGLAAVAQGRPLRAAIDGRADLWSLGLLLTEMLDERPRDELGKRMPAARSCGKSVPSALSALLRRCLATDPADRYESADELANDLRRHLADLPLRGVSDRSPLERWRKWRRRQPHALLFALLVLLVVLSASLLAVHVRRQIDLRSEIQNQQRRAERAAAAGELHRFCESIRPMYAAESLSPTEARRAAAQCRRLWEERDKIVRCLIEPLDSTLENQLRTDFLDLAILWAHLHVRSANLPAAAVHEESLALLAQAEELAGPSRLLYLERRAHAEALGRMTLARKYALRAAELSPRSAWEHYALDRLRENRER